MQKDKKDIANNHKSVIVFISPTRQHKPNQTKDKHMTTTTNKTKTIISNSFTGYSATLRTNGKPAMSTIKKHVGKSKAQGCSSITYIYIDGVGYDIYHGELIKNGLYANA